MPIINAQALIYLPILLVQHQGIFITFFWMMRIPCLILTLRFGFPGWNVY